MVATIEGFHCNNSHYDLIRTFWSALHVDIQCVVAADSVRGVRAGEQTRLLTIALHVVDVDAPVARRESRSSQVEGS